MKSHQKMSLSGRDDGKNKASLDISEMSCKGGYRPLNGIKFVAHKVQALERMIEKLGAFLAL